MSDTMDELARLRAELAAERIARREERAAVLRELHAEATRLRERKGMWTTGSRDTMRTFIADAFDQYADRLAAGPTPPLAVVAACDCRAAVEGLLHTIRHEDRQPSESYCAALSDVIDMLTTGAMPFTCPHCGFVHYDERQRIVCNNCGEPPNKGGCDDGQ